MQAVAPNLLQRMFEVDAPDTVRVADITAVWAHGGWVHFAAVMDLYNRQIVG